MSRTSRERRIDGRTRVGRRTTAALALVVTLAGVSLAGCTSTTQDGQAADGSTPPGSLSLLFVQGAASGSMTEQADGSDYDLVLDAVDARTLWFSDRPQRQAGSQSTSTFVGQWDAFGFSSDPPNAALVLDGQATDRNTTVVELRSPTYDAAAGTLTYDARILDAPREGLTFVTDRVASEPAATFAGASLFIDDANLPATVAPDGSIAPASSSAGTTSTAASPASTSTATTASTPTTAAAAPTTALDPSSATTIDPNPPNVSTPTTTGAPPAPGPQVVGPAAPASASPVLAAVISTWTSMTWTLYSHQDSEDTATGRYQFDCVGATNYFLSLGAPNANDALRSTFKIAPGYVPTPAQVTSFFASLPAGGTDLWTPVAQASGIQPGDIIAVPPAPGSTEPGHAMIAAGPPLLLSNGNYALLVYDSTAIPAHGPSDTRTWDTRNQPLQPGNKASGLGSGTVEITVAAGGAPDLLRWSVGGVEYGGQLEIARPLS